MVRRCVSMPDFVGLLHTIPFRQLDKWYAEYYLNFQTLNSAYEMVRLSTIIKPVVRRIKKSNYNGILPIVSKIVFKTGKIVFRKEKKTGMDLLSVKKGDMLVSSINFHQGAVALNDIGDFVCSTHYQTFSIDNKKIIPEYLIKVLRSASFINMVTGIKAEGIKNESGYDFIGGFEIPVPPKSTQEEILRTYHATLAEADKNMLKGENFCNNLLYDIQAMVSDLNKEEHNLDSSTSIMKIIPFTSTKRWEVDYILKEGCLENIYESFKYKSYSISDLQTESLFGLSVKASSEQHKGMIPMLRMPNIVEGEIDCSELKYLPRKAAVTSKEPDKYLLRKGDFLINRTNSKELVGKSAVFNLDGEYTYASYVIRYRFDTEKVLPEYVNILFMLPIVRIQIDTMSRQTAGQCNINSDEIGSIRIPVPPISVQKNIIEKYYSTKDGANTYYDRANELRNKAATDFEKSIFS